VGDSIFKVLTVSLFHLSILSNFHFIFKDLPLASLVYLSAGQLSYPNSSLSSPLESSLEAAECACTEHELGSLLYITDDETREAIS